MDATNSPLENKIDDRSESMDTIKLNSNSTMHNARFFVIKRKEGSFQNISPFLIQKSLHSIIGDVKGVKKLRSGDLLVEVTTANQALNLSKCTALAHIPVSVTAHNSLNFSRGVIYERDLLYTSEAEILENLRQQNICNVRRITSRRDGVVTPTPLLTLTFETPTLPSFITAGYLRCAVRPYIPNPLRCFECQRFGHSKQSCRGTLTCARCAEPGHDSDNCSKTQKCVNCKGDHPSYSRACPSWKKEKEIQTLKYKNGISYPEARKIVNSRTPMVGVSYSAALSTAPKSTKSIATQTEPIVNYPKQVNAKTVTKSPTKTVKPSTNSKPQQKKVTTKKKLPPSKILKDSKTPLKVKLNRRDFLRNRPTLADDYDDPLKVYVSSEEDTGVDNLSESEVGFFKSTPR